MKTVTQNRLCTLLTVVCDVSIYLVLTWMAQFRTTKSMFIFFVLDLWM